MREEDEGEARGGEAGWREVGEGTCVPVLRERNIGGKWENKE